MTYINEIDIYMHIYVYIFSLAPERVNALKVRLRRQDQSPDFLTPGPESCFPVGKEMHTVYNWP